MTNDVAALTDEELEDMGMYRCACGKPFAPDGSGIPHCRAEAELRGESHWQFDDHGNRLGPEDFTPPEPPLG